MKTCDFRRLAMFLLRAGLASAFVYASASQLFHPNSWIGWFPSWMLAALDHGDLLLRLFSLFQIGLAIWLLSEKAARYAALCAAATFLLIVLFNLPALDVVFRDVALLFSALALAALEWCGRIEVKGLRAVKRR